MKRYRLFFAIPAAALIVLLCYSITRAMMIYIPQQREKRDFNALKESVRISEHSTDTESGVGGDGNVGDNASGTREYKYQPLVQQNSDFVGWLTIDDSLIDYPVMKSSEDDPEYYLHRDFYGKASSSGCLFVGGGCDTDSEAFIIYGHNMNNDTMFGTLDSYYDYDYAVSHQDIRFSAPDGERVYRVFAAFQTRVYNDRDDVFKYYNEVGQLGEDEYEQTVETVRSMSIPSLPYAPEYPAQIMFLSTCSYHTDDGRFVVAAYRIT